MPNVSHENHLILMRMTVQVTYIFIPIVSLKDSFCHRGKSKLGIGLFIHELLREPLIFVMIPYISSTGYPPKTQGIMGHVQVANRVFMSRNYRSDSCPFSSSTETLLFK